MPRKETMNIKLNINGLYFLKEDNIHSYYWFFTHFLEFPFTVVLIHPFTGILEKNWVPYGTPHKKDKKLSIRTTWRLSEKQLSIKFRKGLSLSKICSLLTTISCNSSQGLNKRKVCYYFYLYLYCFFLIYFCSGCSQINKIN